MGLDNEKVLLTVKGLAETIADTTIGAYKADNTTKVDSHYCLVAVLFRISTSLDKINEQLRGLKQTINCFLDEQKKSDGQKQEQKEEAIG